MSSPATREPEPPPPVNASDPERTPPSHIRQYWWHAWLIATLALPAAAGCALAKASSFQPGLAFGLLLAGFFLHPFATTKLTPQKNRLLLILLIGGWFVILASLIFGCVLGFHVIP